MINNEMAENFHQKAKEIYYRNFHILIDKINSNKTVDHDINLTTDELRSGLHTSITLFLKSIICKKDYLKLIENENDYTTQYLIENFDNFSTVDAKNIYKIVKKYFSNDVNFKNDYDIDFDSFYNEGFKIRNKYFHSTSYGVDEEIEGTLKKFLAVNQIFLNNKFKVQIYKDILRTSPPNVLKDKNTDRKKSNTDLFINRDNIKSGDFIMYDSVRYGYFKIIINIFKLLKEPKIKKKVFSLEHYNKSSYQYFCPNCTPYNVSHLSHSEYSHNYSLLDSDLKLNENMKSLISINPDCSLFKCICCNDEYFLKDKVNVCNHIEDLTKEGDFFIFPAGSYMIDNVCLHCGKENFGNVENIKNGVYIVSKIHIKNQKNFKPNQYLFSDPKKDYIFDKRREKRIRRRTNIFKRGNNAI